MKVNYPLLSVLLAGLAFNVLAGEKVDQQLDASRDGNVDIENVRGKVSITGWDKNQVSVKGELDEKTEKFIFEQRGSGIYIKVKTPHHFGHGSFSDDEGSDLTIMVPENSKLNFDGVSTDVTLANLMQRSEVKSVSGSINGTNLAGNIDLSSVSGDITTDKLEGKIALATVSGDIKDRHSSGRLSLHAVSGNLDSQSQATEVSAEAVSGEIRLDLAKVDALELNSVSDNVRASFSLNDKGSVDASSVSGDVELYFANEVQASFRLTSNAGGNIKNKLSDDKAKTAKYGPGEKLRFTTGDGNGSVEVSTVSGDIKVARK